MFLLFWIAKIVQIISFVYANDWVWYTENIIMLPHNILKNLSKTIFTYFKTDVDYQQVLNPKKDISGTQSLKVQFVFYTVRQ